MSLVKNAVIFLRSRKDLADIPASKYEYAVENENGKQLSIDRRASKDSLRFFLEGHNSLDGLVLSPSTKVEKLTAAIPRVHLKATNLRGPYDGSAGNAALRITVETKIEFKKIVEAYFAP